MDRRHRKALRKRARRWKRLRRPALEAPVFHGPMLELLEERRLLSASVLESSALYSFDTSALSAELAIAIEGITTTGSDIELQRPSIVAAEDSTSPSLTQSGSVIRLPQFNANPLFAGIDGSGYSVVILDTGIDLDHSFFGPDANSNGIADRIVYSFDFADNDSNASDVHGHGSNVTSIVASQNSTYPGVAPGVNIIALKVFKNDGSGTFGMVENALQWVVANAAAYNILSVNMSLGDTGNYSTQSSRYGIGDELSALAGMNVIVVSAAGNDFYQFNSVQGISYPASDPNSLAVGAVFDANIGGVSYGGGASATTSGVDVITPFSQRHTTLTDIFAPGAAITGANFNGSTTTMHGTSQASPQVAGAVVLAQQLAIQELGRRLTLSEMSSLMRSSATVIFDGDDENDNVTNTGQSYYRLDMEALGLAIIGMAGTSSSETGEIHGAVWNDLNGDGVRDAGEPGLSDWQVFLDQNGNGQRDGGEALALTASDGSYSFTGLAAGNYTVVEIIPTNWSQTYPGVGVGNDYVQLLGTWSGGTVEGGSITPSHEENPPTGSGTFWADVWGEGDYAYLGHYTANSTVDIVHIGDLDDIHLASQWIAPAENLAFFDVKVQNGIGYFSSDNGGGLYIVDVSDPHNPVTIGHIDSTDGGHNNVHNSFIDGDYVYTADSRTANVHVFDVSNPASPTYVRTLTSPTGPVHDITVLDGKLYMSVIFGSGQTHVFDISNVATAAPMLGTVPTTTNSHSNWVTDDGNILVSAQEATDGSVTIWDISNLASPQLLATMTAGSLGISAFSPHNPMIAGDLLYVAWYQAGVQVIDISNPASPVLLGSYDTYPGSNSGFNGNWGVYAGLGPDRILASDIDSGLFILSVAEARSHQVTLADGQVITGIDFGNKSAPVNEPPVLAAIGDQTIAFSTQDLVLNLAATDPNNDPLVFSATGQSLAYHLDQTLGLYFTGNEYLNWGGQNEKWMQSASGTWYYIKPSGQFYKWLGSSNLSGDPLIETLDATHWQNPALLHNAAANNPPAILTVNGNTLTINPNDSFTGKFYVTVLVSDGQGSTDSEVFLVNVTTAGGDAIAPTVTNRTPAPGATLVTSSVNIDVTFSEAVVGVDVTDLVLTGSGAASAVKSAPVNISGNTWRFAVSGLINGAVNVSLAPDANDVEDAAGNDLAPLNWSYTVALPDVTVPTVTNRTPAPGATLVTSSVNIDVTFSEAVVGVDVTDLVLTGSGAASAVKSAPVNISGNTWRFAVSGLINGAVNVSLAPDANDVEDAAGNDLAPLNWSYTVALPDVTVPTVTNRTPAPGATLTSSSAVIDVTFSEAVVGVDVTDLVLTGAGAASAVKSAPIDLGGNTWRFSVSGLISGAVNVSLAPDANDIEDAAGNDLAPLTWSYTVAIADTTAPTVTSRTPAPGATIVTSSVNIDVTFSEPVVGVDVTDIVLTGSGAASAVKSAPIDLGGNTWRFAVSGLVNGAVNVSLAPDANDIEDAAGNDLAPLSWSYTVALPDTTAPTVTNMSPASSATVTTSDVNIDVTFSEAVVGVDVTDLVLAGEAVVSAVISAPIDLGGNTWRFAVSGLVDGPVQVSLAPDANDIEDAAGNDVAPLNWSFKIALPDTIAPTVTNRTPASGATITTTSVNIDVTFSEQVIGVDVTDLVLTGSGAASALTSEPIDLGGNTWRFAVSGLTDGAVNVSLAPDTNDIRDLSGNDLAMLNWSYLVALPDTTAPTVTSRTPAPGATITSPNVNIDVTFSEAVIGVDV
ncbi:MAG: choice-of-anchor B family protein, partial [Phycisphaeraceae bacterium]